MEASHDQAPNLGIKKANDTVSLKEDIFFGEVRDSSDFYQILTIYSDLLPENISVDTANSSIEELSRSGENYYQGHHQVRIALSSECEFGEEKSMLILDLLRLVHSMKYNNPGNFNIHNGFVLPEDNRPNRMGIFPAKTNIPARANNTLRMLTSPQRELTFTKQDTDTETKSFFNLAIRARERTARKPIAGTIGTITENISGESNLSKINEFIVDVDGGIVSSVELGFIISMMGKILSGQMTSLDRNDPNVNDKIKESFLEVYRSLLLSSKVSKIDASQVVGLEEQKNEIITQLLNPLISDKGFPQNIALYGAPGTGKTLLLKQIINETKEVMFIPMTPTNAVARDGSGQLVLSSYIQQTDRIAGVIGVPIVYVFDDAEILFSEEISTDHEGTSIGASMDPGKRNEILSLLEGLNNNRSKVILVFNHPEVLDLASQRRLLPIAFSLPNKEQREAILKLYIHSDNFGISMSEKDIQNIVDLTDGFNSSYLTKFVEELFNEYITSESIEIGKVLKKIQSRVHLDELKNADDAAQRMVNRQNNIGRFGFNPE